MWFLNQLEPQSHVHNVAKALTIGGPLDVSALHGALNRTVERHAVLRTNYTMEGTEPIQIVGEPRPVDWVFTDLTTLPASAVEDEAERLALAQARRPFDLARDLMLRASLLRLAPAQHRLIVVFHHIAFDAWSTAVFLRDLVEFYEAATEERVPTLADLDADYIDFTAWEQDRHSGSQINRHIEYWRGQLAGASVLEIPTEKPRPAVPGSESALVTLDVPREVSEAVASLARRERATEDIVIVAAFAALLHRYAGQHDVVFGTVSAGRPKKEFQNLVGCFVNTLALRIDVSDAPTFLELLLRARATTLDALAHQELPFDRLVTALKPERDAGSSPIFRVMFEYHALDRLPCRLGECTLAVADQETNAAEFDLTFEARRKSGRLRLCCRYKVGLFRDGAAARMLERLRDILAAGASEPSRKVFELPFGPSEDERSLMAEWNRTAVDYPLDTCVHQLFEARAAEDPEAPAVVFGDMQLSYGALNARANRLAHYLIARGAGPGTYVGIYMQRSIEAIVAVLAVLKAGSAYVPLDYTVPALRLSEMLEDFSPVAVLTTSGQRSGVPDSAPETVCLDLEWDPGVGGGDENPPGTATPDDPAYMIYTSGSTGSPKGVLIQHRSLLNYCLAIGDVFHFGARARFAMIQPLAFDLSQTTIFPALTSAGCIVIVPEETGLDRRKLQAYLARNPVDVLKITPSHLSLLRAGGSLQGVLPRTWLISGGEALPSELAGHLLEIGGCRVANHYGPTETTVGATTCEVTRSILVNSGATVPIGRPIPNVQVYVLDGRMQQLPVGVPGELYIGGAGLARGYFRRPRLSRHSFVRDPFSDSPASRLYRTGDRVRFRPDGNLEFIGRLDDQVKLGGFRLELGDVETVLRRHPGVLEAAVVARRNESGVLQLLAYYSAAPDNEPHRRQLLEFLTERLPYYMLPRAFVRLDAIPLTSAGKLDRHALPEPAPEAGARGAEAQAPRTPMERAVADVWQEALGLGHISTGDNFFDLGGHSLLAAQVVSRLRDSLGLEIHLAWLFRSPTVAGLAAILEERQKLQRAPAGEPTGSATAAGANRASEDIAARIAKMSLEERRAFEELLLAQTAARPAADRIPVTKGPGPYPVSFAQQRLWFIDQLEPESPMYNTPVVLRMQGELDAEALELALSDLVTRHEPLRTTFSAPSGVPLQTVNPAVRAGLEVIDLSHEREDVREARLDDVLRTEARAAFDLSRDVMLRARLIRMTSVDHVLLLVIHHIATDGWSEDVLFRELGEFYRARRRGETADVPPLPVRYVDYAVWQRERLKGERLARILDYWRHALADMPHADLPTDRPRPARETHEGDVYQEEFTDDLMDAVAALGRAQAATPFMVTLAALAVLLSRYSGQTDIAIGTPVAGRDRSEIEGLIGFFVNMIVLRVDLSGNPSFAELVARVRKVATDAFANQELPFEMLVAELEPDRDPSRPPFLRVTLAYQNAQRADLVLPGLTITRGRTHSGLAKFDLCIHVGTRNDRTALTWEYATDLYEEATVRRMCGHFIEILRNAAANPQWTVSAIPMVGPTERRMIVEEWGVQRVHYPRQSRVHELFEKQAARSPEAVALEENGRRVTYGELNSRANQLARFLREHGVKRDTAVGIFMERSIGLVECVLAVVKAGGVYVPLDPSYPVRRLEFMVEDAGVELVLTTNASADGLPACGLPILRVDGLRTAVEAHASGDLALEGAAEDRIYVMYTSGSTGRPKGVEVCHRGVVRLVRGARYAELDGGQAILHAAPISFDASTFELWGALLNGGRCVILEDRVPSLHALGKTIREHGVTTVWLTASLFNTVIDEDPAVLASVKQVLTGGEALSLPHVRRALRMLPNARILNCYGPTEATTFACCYPIPRPLSDSLRSVPIGRPITDTTVYILDAQLQVVPVGVPGELCIGGDGLARGYVGRPELTAEKFVRDPFANGSEQRLYRTGDLARWLPDGNIEFLGRADEQVKIRGFRVELGEVESVLAEHDGVRRCAVAIRVKTGPGKRLVAYFVPAEGVRLTDENLRGFLQNRLPDYMVPGAFVAMHELPITANGKVDRDALPDPVEDEPPLRTTKAEPNSLLEARLVQMWRELLDLPAVSVTGDFFDLGGHSLLAVRMLHRIKLELDADIPLASLFQLRTVRQIAEHLQAGREAESRSPLVAFRREGSRKAFYCVASMNPLAYRHLANALGENQPFYVLHPLELLEYGRKGLDIRCLAARYVEAVRAVDDEGPYLLGGMCSGGVVAFEMAQQLARSGRRVGLLVLMDTPFPSRNSLLRAANRVARALHDLRMSVRGRGTRAQIRECLRLFQRAARKAIPQRGGGLHDQQAPTMADYLAPMVRLYRSRMPFYRPQPFDGSIVLFLGRDTWPGVGRDSRLAWRRLAMRGTREFTVPGEHEKMLVEPDVAVLAERLAELVEASQQGGQE